MPYLFTERFVDMVDRAGANCLRWGSRTSGQPMGVHNSANSALNCLLKTQPNTPFRRLALRTATPSSSALRTATPASSWHTAQFVERMEIRRPYGGEPASCLSLLPITPSKEIQLCPFRSWAASRLLSVPRNITSNATHSHHFHPHHFHLYTTPVSVGCLI